jgi:hypothetical protein
MENIFVKTNPVNGNLSINYVEVNNMMKTLNRAVTTREEYFAWVKDWKIYHENLVSAIQGLRMVKQQEKFELGHSEAASIIHSTKLRLRPFAREMYRMRTERKAEFKSGAFDSDEIGFAA